MLQDSKYPLARNIDAPLTNWNVLLNGGDRQVQDSVSGEEISLAHGISFQYFQSDKAMIPFLTGVTTTLGSLIDTLIQRKYPSFNGISVGKNLLNDIIRDMINLVDGQSGLQFYFDWQSVSSTLTK